MGQWAKGNQLNKLAINGFPLGQAITTGLKETNHPGWDVCAQNNRAVNDSPLITHTQVPK